MKVRRNTLLLLACIVWSAAGFNVLRIGLTAYPAYSEILNYLLFALAMAGGVFYREFTKFNGFAAKTSLAVVHTHYFLLGMVFFLLLLLLEKSFSFTGASTKRVLTTYHIGLNLTAVMLAVRGVTQVLGTALSSGMDAAISGMAGIGHILLGVSLVLLLVQLRRAVLNEK